MIYINIEIIYSGHERCDTIDTILHRKLLNVTILDWCDIVLYEDVVCFYYMYFNFRTFVKVYGSGALSQFTIVCPQ